LSNLECTYVPQATTAAFDARRPDGADHVIVPAMSARRSADAIAARYGTHTTDVVAMQLGYARQPATQ
jgi:hypothetical protein